MNVLNAGFDLEDPTIKAKEIKEEYLSQLPNELKLSRLNLTIIDEAIEKIIHEEAVFNDKIPQTKEERFMYISLHQIGALAALKELQKVTLAQNPGQKIVHVDLNYRNQKFEFDLKQ